MTSAKERTQPKSDDSDAEHVASKIADEREAAKPADDDKPDEGQRLDELTTESDGGSQG